MYQIVYELHTLLTKSDVRPPYVLVGHSYGGALVRLYQSTYPSEVAGMVLVETEVDNPWRLTANGKLVRCPDLVTGQAIPAVQTSHPLAESDIPSAALSQIKPGLRGASLHANGPPRDKLPVEAQRMRTWTLGQVKHVVAGVNPVEHEELAEIRSELAKRGSSLRDLPLIVMTRGKPEGSGPEGRFLEDEHRKDHTAIAALSSRGKLIVAGESGHHEQLDEPQLVTSAIQEVISAAGK
jgi:pimeloyl-ACP methyl ester carboxylesterase